MIRQKVEFVGPFVVPKTVNFNSLVVVDISVDVVFSLRQNMMRFSCQRTCTCFVQQRKEFHYVGNGRHGLLLAIEALFPLKFSDSLK